MANTDEIPYQPVWVTFDPVACGVILRGEIEDKIDSKVWQMFGVNQGFHEDKFPSVILGEVHLPTFDWLGMINGRRRSDETCFYTKLRIPKAEIPNDKINLPILMHMIGNAIAWFNSFSDCDCKVGKPCDYHARMEFTGESVEAGEGNG